MASKGTGVDYLAAPGGDAAVAASYLKKAGYASGRYSGEPILMVGPVDGNGRRISEIAKAAFEKLGFEVKLRLLSQQIVQTKYCGFPASAVAVCPNVGWARDFADGQTYLDPTFNGANIQPVGNANVSQLDVPAVNDAIEQATTLTDPAARADAWGAVDRAIVAEAPAVPLVWDKVSMAHSADVNAVPTRTSACGTSRSLRCADARLSHGSVTTHARPGEPTGARGKVASPCRSPGSKNPRPPRRRRSIWAPRTGACRACRSRPRPMSTARCRSSSASPGSGPGSARRSRPPRPAATSWW